MNFSEALTQLKNQKKVSRSGWNGKGMYVMLINGIPDLNLLPYLQMFTADKKLVPWLASQTDVLAEDWSICS